MHVAREHEADAGQKGKLGEEFISLYLVTIGLPYRATLYKDKLDFFFMEKNYVRSWIEVKTYELMRDWTTGIDKPDYLKYERFLIDEGVSKSEVKFWWVDWEQKQVYGQTWENLERPYYVGKKLFPRWSYFKTQWKHMYHREQMEFVVDIPNSLCEKLSALTHKRDLGPATIYTGRKITKQYERKQQDFFAFEWEKR